MCLSENASKFIKTCNYDQLSFCCMLRKIKDQRTLETGESESGNRKIYEMVVIQSNLAVVLTENLQMK